MRRRSWIQTIADAIAPRRLVRIVEGDSLPEKLPYRDLVLVREDGEDWCIGLRCPCGCGRKLEMLLLKGVKPRWDVFSDKAGYVSLHPSVWLRDGCKSHFWIRRGRVIWCS